jgi:hypothetical protein
MKSPLYRRHWNYQRSLPQLAMSCGFQLTVSWDRLIATYERGLEAARREFGFGI